jgi:hypothetical protein
MSAVRTARCAVLFWQDGKLVWDNYLRHEQFALTAECERVLRWTVRGTAPPHRRDVRTDPLATCSAWHRHVPSWRREAAVIGHGAFSPPPGRARAPAGR